MKQINQLIHCTKTIERLKSILENGLFTSYNKEDFFDETVLVPMISFSNVLFRDLGNNETMDYGSYGIAVNRDKFTFKHDLNPVLYFKNESEIGEGIKKVFFDSIIVEILPFVKEFYQRTNGHCGDFLSKIGISNLSTEALNIIGSINENTPDEVFGFYKSIFEKVFLLSRNQILISKPCKIENAQGEFIAYNEREWRKSFFDLNYVKQTDGKGNENPLYKSIINSPKPHIKEEKYSLKISLNELTNIFVENESDVEEISNFLKRHLNFEPSNGFVSTLDNLKKKETAEL